MPHTYDPSIFDLSKPSAAPDPLTLTMSEFNALSDLERTAVMNRGRLLTNLPTLSAVAQRIAEYITSRSLDAMPTRLDDINRRFSPACKRLKVAPSELVYHLAEQGLVVQLNTARYVMYFNAALLNEFETARNAYFETKASEDERAKWISNIDELVRNAGPAYSTKYL